MTDNAMSFAAHPAFLPITGLTGRLTQTNTTVLQIATLKTHCFRVLGDFCVSSFDIPKINMQMRSTIKAELCAHGLKQSSTPLPLSATERESLLHSVDKIGTFFEIQPDLLNADLNLKSGQYRPSTLYVVEMFSRAARGLPIREETPPPKPASISTLAKKMQYMDQTIEDVFGRITSSHLRRHNIVYVGQLLALSGCDLKSITGTADRGLSPATHKKMKGLGLTLQSVNYNMRATLEHISNTQSAETPFTLVDAMNELRAVPSNDSTAGFLPTVRAMDSLRTLFYTHARCHRLYAREYTQDAYGAMSDMRSLTLHSGTGRALADTEKRLADKVQNFMDRFAQPG
ncbi:MAG: hypothetical protein V4621_03810 [Pseudomonadota bacterium]